ncbi:MAG: serine/threonine protein kinase [Archangiaceae bacterium]|nr:serine/threonine protein kinase [Archangiaceae bacterium]
MNRCLQKDIAGRFASMDQARDALLEANMARLTGPREGMGTVSMRRAEEPPVVRGKLESEAKFLGPYELKELLGEGGMGQVWLAEHKKLERKVAIKLLKPELVRVESQVQRFFDEARAVNKVNHPHIVEITDFVEERDMGRVWCVMEYLKGNTLKVLGREQTLSIARSVNIVRQVADALDAAHAVGVVHRDIKPDNIFLVDGKGNPDFVKVLDFGVAKLRAEHSAEGHTDTGEIVGTPAYMSPEQALGQEVDRRSDLYSLGTLLYVLLAGRFPFDGVTAGQLVANIVARQPLPLPQVARSGEVIDDALDRVVMKCLEKSPSRRYPDMRALAEALQPFEVTSEVMVVGDDALDIEDTGETAAALPPVELELDVDDEARPSGSGRKVAVLAALAVVLAAAGLTGRALWLERAATGSTVARQLQPARPGEPKALFAPRAFAVAPSAAAQQAAAEAVKARPALGAGAAKKASAAAKKRRR